MTAQQIEHWIAPDAHGLRPLEPLARAFKEIAGVRAEIVGSVAAEGDTLPFWRLAFEGPNSAAPIRIGIFGAIHGDEPAGALAAVALLQRLSAKPALAENFLLHVYPICNPSGFQKNTRESQSGRDLNRQFWRNSPDPEVQILERELKTHHFTGLVQLHADDTSDGVYGFVRGHVLTENLLRPALRAAGEILPRNRNATIDGFAAVEGIIYQQYHGILAAPPEVSPVPFEIVLETPQKAPLHLQVEAFESALLTILAEYRQLISFAADL